MVNIRDEQEEALFHSHQRAVYYVQSPSNNSQSNSTTDCNKTINATAFLSLYPCEELLSTDPIPSDNNQLVLVSSYCSSLASDNSFLNEKKIAHERHQRRENLKALNAHQISGLDDDDEDEVERYEDDDEDNDIVYYIDQDDKRSKKVGCRRYISFNRSSSCCWISLQISWRAMVSLCAALLVFFLATNPPPPNMSVKIVEIGQFWLREGIDESGVATKILTCNCSINLIVDNKSKLFRLHIHHSIIQLSYGPLIFASSQGPRLYADIHGFSMFQLYVGTKNKAMYGAGRDMQDMFQSTKGLQLKLNLVLQSKFYVVWNLISLRFHHHVACMLILYDTYDKRLHTQAYNSNCRTISS